MELKNRVVVVSEKNMDELVSLYGKCSMDEMERIVNNIIDNAVAEIREDEGRLHMNQWENKAPECNGCEFMKEYSYGKRIYYCDHVDRIDDMGKLGVDKLPEGSPMWCPLMCKRNDNSTDLIKMYTDTDLTDKYGNPIEIRVPEPEYMPEIFGKL